MVFTCDIRSTLCNSLFCSFSLSFGTSHYIEPAATLLLCYVVIHLDVLCGKLWKNSHPMFLPERTHDMMITFFSRPCEKWRERSKYWDGLMNALWTNEILDEWMNGWMNRSMEGWMEGMHEWRNEQTNKQTNEQMNERINQGMKELINSSRNEWLNEWMKEWNVGWIVYN